MDVGGYFLTPEQAAAWQAEKPDEYQEYLDSGLFDPITGELYAVPDWMVDGDPLNGPFDFSYNASHEGADW